MKKISRLIICFLLLAEVVHSQNKHPHYEAYIQKYYKIAIDNMANYGIPASITLAQGLFESGAGESRLAKEANNHFGIKCHDWDGPTITHDDDKLRECFRKYKHAEESFSDHSTFLTTRPRYAFLFDLDPYDYKSWARGLKQAGYATNPRYPETLIKLIEDYELYEYDTDVIVNRQPATQENLLVDSLTIEQVLPSGEMVISPYVSHKVQKNNRVKYVLANANDSYEGIAREFGLKVKEIYKVNEVDMPSKPKAGEKIYIRTKKSRSKASPHTVKSNETIRDIAQQYAVRQKSILKINKLKKGDGLKVGQKIHLN